MKFLSDVILTGAGADLTVPAVVTFSGLVGSSETKAVVINNTGILSTRVLGADAFKSTDGVLTTGNQTVAGVKTFSSLIVANSGLQATSLDINGSADISGNLTVGGTTILDGLQLEASDDYITFYGGNSTQHSISARGLTGVGTDDLRFNTYGSFIINLDSNNNQTSEVGSSFYIGRHAGAASTMSDILFKIDGSNGDVEANGNMDINGNADISGTITSATWGGAIIAANKIATLNQHTTGTAANATLAADSTLSNGFTVGVAVPANAAFTDTQLTIGTESGHAMAGNTTIPAAESYTAHENISGATSVNGGGRQYIQDITLDGNGHVTSVATATETVTDTIYTLPLAADVRGGVKVGYSENGKNYPIELSSEQMYVNVPWTDTTTTDTQLTTAEVRGKISASGNSSYNSSTGVITSTNTTYNTATTSTAGIVKIGYTESGKNYPVELASGKMYVNVPWVNTQSELESDADEGVKGIVALATEENTTNGIGRDTATTPRAVKGAIDSIAVPISGNKTITGVKTFSSTIVGSINGNSATTSETTITGTQATAITDNTAKVGVSTGAQTIAGVKTFSSRPKGVLESWSYALSDETTDIATGTSVITVRAPYAITVTDVRASLSTASTGGTLVTVDVNSNGSTILSGKVKIDNGEKTSVTAVSAVGISTSNIGDDHEITFDIDAAGVGAKGLKVTIIGYQS